MAPALRRRVAFIYGFPLAVGGVESHLLSLVAHGDRTAFEWCVIGPVEESFRCEAERLGCAVIDWVPPRGQLDLRGARRLARLFRGQCLDLVHVHSPRGLPLVAWAACMARVPLVSTVHLPVRFLLRQGALGAAKLRLYELFDCRVLKHLIARTIFVSARVHADSVRRHLVRPERALVIRNGVKLEKSAGAGRRAEVRATLGAGPDTVVACGVGRLDEQKGFDVLIEALSLLDLVGLQLVVWLVGDGPGRAALAGRVHALGLGERVHFLARRSDVGALLAASDIFFLPSRWEAMPISLLEALATGLPSIATDVGDCALVVEHGRHGLIVPPEQPTALARAIETLARERALREQMGKAAREHAREFSADTTARRVEEVYRAVLAESSPPGVSA